MKRGRSAKLRTPVERGKFTPLRSTVERGKFIVIEGVDGSGKGTQSKLLIKKLLKNGYKVKVMDFPQYGKTFFGDLAGRFLKGDFGTLKEVNPFLASLPFAGDRWQAKDEINNFLNKGYMVVSNRYAMSNMGHQASKFTGKKRKEILDYLEKLEYKIYGIPREDLVLILDIDTKISKKLILKKSARGYLGKKKKDIHEADIQYQTETRKVYLSLIKKYKHVRKIECTNPGGLLSIEEIHSRVWKVVEKVI